LLGQAFQSWELDLVAASVTKGFVEENVSVFKDKDFFASCKNQMQNTVFCGKFLLFLAKFFPFSERSGLNIVSKFNVDNVTEYGSDELTESLELTENPLKIDYNLYCKFWSLQEFFCCHFKNSDFGGSYGKQKRAILSDYEYENRSCSPSPHEVTPTPSFTLEHHDSR
jgi:hypothetical protein